jgi:hypothetical protein
MIGKPDRTKARQFRWYRGANVPMRPIRRFAREVAERFQPDKIAAPRRTLTALLHGQTKLRSDAGPVRSLLAGKGSPAHEMGSVPDRVSLMHARQPV